MRSKTFLNDLLASPINPMKPWSLRSGYRMKKYGGSHAKLINDIRKVLKLLSGNEIIPMLNQVLTIDQKKQLLPSYEKALREYSFMFNQANPKYKYMYLNPIRKAGVSINDAKKLGFKTNFFTWKSCLNMNSRKKGGRKAISNSIKREMFLHLQSNSSIAANRMLKRGNKQVRYLNNPVNHVYNNFHRNNEISLSTFYKYVGPEFKTATRFSDLCDFCELFNSKSTEILLAANTLGFHEITNLKQVNLYQFKEFLSQFTENHDSFELIKKTISDIRDCEALEYHKSIAKRQRESYNNMKNDTLLLKNSILIELDFKQKIVIGLGPRQCSTDYYNQVQRSFLGFGIYFVDEFENIKCLNMDVVLSNTKQDAFAVIRAFRHIRKQDCFKKIEKQKFIIWTDCGPHFR